MRPLVPSRSGVGADSADRLCVLAGEGLREQPLRECHDGLLGGLGRTKTGSLVRHLAFWVEQDVDVAEYVRTCQTFQRTKAAHAGLQTTAAGFDMTQNHVDLLSGKVHAVPTRATATAGDAAEIRSGAGFPDPAPEHDAKFTSEVFRAFVKSMGSSLV